MIQHLLMSLQSISCNYSDLEGLRIETSQMRLVLPVSKVDFCLTLITITVQCFVCCFQSLNGLKSMFSDCYADVLALMPDTRSIPSIFFFKIKKYYFCIFIKKHSFLIFVIL